MITIDLQNSIVRNDALDFLQSLGTGNVALIIPDPAFFGMNQYLKLVKGRTVGEYKDNSDEVKLCEKFQYTTENFGLFVNISDGA